MKLPLVNNNADTEGEIEGSDLIFGIKPNLPAIHAALRWELAGRRSGSAKAKTRGEVRGGGKKPHRQKGTGRARAGSTRSPLWRGGGVIFGPRPRSYKYALPRRVVKLALRSIFSDRAAEKKVLVVDKFNFSAAKTKEAAGFLAKLKLSGKTFVLSAASDGAEEKCFSNLAQVKYTDAANLNIHDLVLAQNILITEAGLKKLNRVIL
jgi:large subunit ribosomal protein L4